jgi:hypothetical protein
MAWLMTATAILSGIAIIFLIILLVIYLKNYARARAHFTLGLIIFTALFLITHIVGEYYYLTMMEYYVPAVQTHVFILTLLQAAAFGVMLKISWE